MRTSVLSAPGSHRPSEARCSVHPRGDVFGWQTAGVETRQRGSGKGSRICHCWDHHPRDGAVLASLPRGGAQITMQAQ